MNIEGSRLKFSFMQFAKLGHRYGINVFSWHMNSVTTEELLLVQMERRLFFERQDRKLKVKFTSTSNYSGSFLMDIDCGLQWNASKHWRCHALRNCCQLATFFLYLQNIWTSLHCYFWLQNHQINVLIYRTAHETHANIIKTSLEENKFE